MISKIFRIKRFQKFRGVKGFKNFFRGIKWFQNFRRILNDIKNFQRYQSVSKIPKVLEGFEIFRGIK